VVELGGPGSRDRVVGDGQTVQRQLYAHALGPAFNVCSHTEDQGRDQKQTRSGEDNHQGNPVGRELVGIPDEQASAEGDDCETRPEDLLTKALLKQQGVPLPGSPGFWCLR
jgi:hypothetical protein